MEPVHVKSSKVKNRTRSVRTRVQESFIKLEKRPVYRWAIYILGLPVTLFALFLYLFKKQNDPSKKFIEEIEEQLRKEGHWESLHKKFRLQLEKKIQFFNQAHTPSKLDKEARKWANEQFQTDIMERSKEKMLALGNKKVTFSETFLAFITNKKIISLLFLPGLLMYVFLLICINPYLKFILERLIMSIFVIFGVTLLVFTILYFSPFDPAVNILGETATKDQIANFNHIYGLDQSYFHQLIQAFKGIFTFDLGNSYTGNEEVVNSIARKFPITFTLAFISLIMAILIAIPIGIISATKPNSIFDYSFMFIALIGLSIPNFWQGLIFILNFSIKLKWFPATYVPDNWISIIMPAVVLGTGLTASIARMMRSSTLEIINEDYIITAKAKGLSKSTVIWRHAVTNAMIPVITVIGLLFGGMLGGAAVTEKVFNINGIGSFIVDKQFIPDIPSILGGVVYIAITISLVNLLIDVLYAFFDPRIRTKMKQY
ncbi:ABC transporter permease [Niallia circulans]|uniref:ABC transporter permease n=1 Tax=Niallia circulans TaxID=1397 RepID=UPI003D97D620